MLVLTRKEGESIIIGDNVKIMIINAQDGRARIGIDAPKEIPIAREEVKEAYDKRQK